MPKKITIYTLADKRPDFITVQYDTLKRFVKDEYEYIVYNNAIDSKQRKDEIFRICKELNIKCIEVKKDARFNMIGNQKAISWTGQYVNPNVACAYPIKWAWEEICNYNIGKIFILIHSDMFLCRNISFNKEIENFDSSLIMQYRGLQNNGNSAMVKYIGDAIVIFDTDKTKNIKEINWDCGLTKKSFINGYGVDVGGYTHFWLEKNKINSKKMSEYAIHNFKIKENGNILIEANINGNFQYSFEYNFKNKQTYNFQSKEKSWHEKNKILPHFPNEFETILKNKTIKYFEKYIFNKQTYPKPTFLGFTEFETFTEEFNPFIIHIKGGSGYLGLGGFSNEYAKLKLDFIKKTLNIQDSKISNVFLKNKPSINDILKTDIKIIVKMLLFK